MLVKKLSICLVLFSFTSLALAAETDQFYAYERNAVIRDSSEELNRFYDEHIDIALHKVNSNKDLLGCREVAAEVLKQVVGEFDLGDYYRQKTFSKVSYFTQKSPLVDRFPDGTVSNDEYRSHSIYKNRPFPAKTAQLGRTINVKNIYFGTDKIGHFAIVGRNYYRNFMKYLKKGITLEVAEMMAIQDGINEEINILGYTLGGVFSYGDLEANYQGFRFGRDLCEGDNPFLIMGDGKWVKNPNRKFDLKKYVNPKFDETYNVSFWSPRMWKKLKNEIKVSYCNNLNDPRLKDRLSYYQTIQSSSLNDQVIAQFLTKRPEFDRNKQLLGVTCEKI